MTDIPAEIPSGKIIGKFVAFYADGSDEGALPDEVPLTGSVVLTPTVRTMRWPGTTPPRTAVVQAITCPIIDGFLCAPYATTSDDQGVIVIATNQPTAEPNLVQWTAAFRFTGVTQQPSDITFNVPAGGVLDLTLVVPASSQPGEVIVVSSETRVAAEAAASRAETAASQAQALVGDAETLDARIDTLETDINQRISGLTVLMEDLTASDIATSTEDVSVQSWMDSIDQTLNSGVVSSVNGKTGSTITLSADDFNAGYTASPSWTQKNFNDAMATSVGTLSANKVGAVNGKTGASVTLTGADINTSATDTEKVSDKLAGLRTDLGTTQSDLSTVQGLVGTPSAGNTGGSIVLRNSEGNASISDPKASTHIATKGYVDGKTTDLIAGGRLGVSIGTVTDADSATDSGTYMISSTGANIPIVDRSMTWLLEVVRVSTGSIYQEAISISTTLGYRTYTAVRNRSGSTWSSWVITNSPAVSFTPAFISSSSNTLGTSTATGTYMYNPGRLRIDVELRTNSSATINTDIIFTSPIPVPSNLQMTGGGRFTIGGTSYEVATLLANGNLYARFNSTNSSGTVVQTSNTATFPTSSWTGGVLQCYWDIILP